MARYYVLVLGFKMAFSVSMLLRSAVPHRSKHSWTRRSELYELGATLDVLFSKKGSLSQDIRYSLILSWEI